MDTFRHPRSPPAERFVGFFSSPPGYLAAAGTADDDSPGVELREDEVFWTGVDHSAHSPPAAAASPRVSAAASPSSSSSRSFRSPSGKSLIGILAALPEENVGNPGFLHRNPSTSPASNASTSPSPFSSARMIPGIPKPKHADYSILHQSAPVNVPVVPGKRRSGSPVEEPDGDDYDNDGEMLPPHEIVARKGTPATTSSVLEGVGRTLKGRDLRRVRNAVLRQTGFLDLN